jgi:hypothetical protein
MEILLGALAAGTGAIIGGGVALIRAWSPGFGNIVGLLFGAAVTWLLLFSPMPGYYVGVLVSCGLLACLGVGIATGQP